MGKPSKPAYMGHLQAARIDPTYTLATPLKILVQSGNQVLVHGRFSQSRTEIHGNTNRTSSISAHSSLFRNQLLERNFRNHLIPGSVSQNRSEIQPPSGQCGSGKLPQTRVWIYYKK